jgi:hypothetical protein
MSKVAVFCEIDAVLFGRIVYLKSMLYQTTRRHNNLHSHRSDNLQVSLTQTAFVDWFHVL